VLLLSQKTRALVTMNRSVLLELTRNSSDKFAQSLPVQARLFKSLKLWSFYVDLEESIGSVETTKHVYDKILELRIANAQVWITLVVCRCNVQLIYYRSSSIMPPFLKTINTSKKVSKSMNGAWSFSISPFHSKSGISISLNLSNDMYVPLIGNAGLLLTLPRVARNWNGPETFSSRHLKNALKSTANHSS
jgi:hypothetical protein